MPVRQEILLANEPRAPFLARRHVTQAVSPRTLASDRLDDARLAVSELVSNVLRHAGVPPKDSIGVVIDTAEERLRVEVEQPSSASSAHLVDEPDGDGASHGYGLRLVDAVADAWGVEPGPPGRVWFEIRL